MKSSASSSRPLSGTLWFIVACALFGSIAGYLLASTVLRHDGLSSDRSDSQTQQAQPASDKAAAGNLQETQFIFGNQNAPVSLISYTNFSCPRCAQHFSTMRLMVDLYKGKVNWLMYYYSPQAGEPGEVLAKNLLCAGLLKGNDAYWQMLQGYMKKGVDSDTVAALVAAVQITPDALASCTADPQTSQLIEKHRLAGAAAGVTEVPALVVLQKNTGEKSLFPAGETVENIRLVIDRLIR